MGWVAFVGFLALCTAIFLYLAHPNRDPDAMCRHRAQRRAIARCHARVINRPPFRPLETTP